MLAKTYACEIVGLEGHIVEVEVDFSATALPAFIVVGLPDAAVQESKERVRAAINNSGLRFRTDIPDHINLRSPAFDLVALLAASGDLAEFNHSVFLRNEG